MITKKWKKTGEEISILGFGAMRLPMTGGENPQVDEERSVAMIRSAIDSGVNYLDTAWPYHEGQSELVCAKAMKDGYRDKVKIATKLPSWEIKEHKDMMDILDQQLKKLEVSSIDYYLLHTITHPFWENYKKLDYKAFLKEAKAAGKIKHYGFSFHSDLDLFKEVVDDFDWEFVQIQLNYMDETYQAGLEGMAYAAEKGMDVIVMEPLRGGMLAQDPPDAVKSLFGQSPNKRTPAEWALRYLWDKPEVSLILSGMSTEEQLAENIKTASTAAAGHLSAADKDIIDGVKAYYKERIRVNCTSCRYCMPCPAGVNIPECFWAYNHDAIFEDTGKAMFWINGFLPEENRPSKCVDCGACEEHCPQNISIREHLKKIVDMYEQPQVS